MSKEQEAELIAEFGQITDVKERALLINIIRTCAAKYRRLRTIKSTPVLSLVAFRDRGDHSVAILDSINNVPHSITA